MKSTTLIWATGELTGTTRSSWSSESRFSTEKPSRTGLTASLTGDTRHRGEGTYRTGLGLSRALNCRGETWTGDSVIQSFIVYSGLGGGHKDRQRGRGALEEKCGDIPHGSGQIHMRLLIIRLLRSKRGCFGASQLKLLENLHRLLLSRPWTLRHVAKSNAGAGKTICDAL